MKYVSLDIETTAIKPENGLLLELGLVFHTDFETPVEDLPTRRFIFLHKEIYGEPYALNLNKDLIAHIKDVLNGGPRLEDVDYVAVTTSCEGFDPYSIPVGMIPSFLAELVTVTFGKPKTCPAGKNPAGFDLPWLRYHLKDELIMFRHRVLDPATHFLQKGDEEPPSLQLCLERAGIHKTVAHTGVEDAQDVVKLLRIAMKKQGLY